ncbi:50S ribosomal protein L11 methyltransferase [Rhodobacteraceae bacterium NNCM2]|nr:50S ribosomal protein L11 methyltransferase [Coraliihabitans acroporae]
MSTYTALTTLPDRGAAEALGEALEAMSPAPTGVGVFEIEDGTGTWEVGGYFVDPPDRAALMLLAAMHGAKDFAVSKLPDHDWVAQVRRELSPVKAGRFVVHGGHDSHRIAPNQIGIRIEAAMAFGTGHHETTRGCLLLIESLARSGKIVRQVGDIGSGTGVLGMAAAKIWRCPVLATDIDPIAVATARENVRVNGTQPWVLSARAVGTRLPLYRERRPFDLILANILAAPLKRLAPQVRDNLAPGGHAVLSGLLTRQIPSVEAVYGSHGFAVEKRLTLGEWTSLILRKHARYAL